MGFVWQSVMSKGLNIGEGEIRVRTAGKKIQVDGHGQNILWLSVVFYLNGENRNFCAIRIRRNT